MNVVEKRYSISEISKQFGLSDATIRKYEKDFDINVPRNELGHRYYTEKEITVFDQIVKLKDQGANLHVINKILERSPDYQNLQEKSLELITMDKMTGLEVKQLLDRYFTDVIMERERELVKEYEDKIDQAKKEIKEEVIASMRDEFTEQHELIKKENEFLVTRLKKRSFWDLFKKK